RLHSAPAFRRLHLNDLRRLRRVHGHLLCGGEDDSASDILRLEESPKIRGLDVVADGAGLGALAQGLRERQKQRQHTDEERYLLVDVVAQGRGSSMGFAMLGL